MKRTLFIKLMALFILFFITPVIVISLVLEKAIVANFKDEVSEASLNKLAVIKDAVEIALDGISESALMVATSEELNRLSEIEDKISTMDVDHVFAVRQFMNMIANTQRLNNRIHSIYLYHETAGVVLTSNREFKKVDEFYDTNWINSYTQSSKSMNWISTRDSIDEGKTLSQDSNFSPAKVITFVHPLSSYITRLKGAIVINLREDRLYNVIGSNIRVDEGKMIVVDANNHVVSSDNKELVGMDYGDMPHIQRIISAETNQGYITTDIDQQKHLVTYIRSEVNGWNYISLSPMDVLLTRVETLRVLLLYISVMLVLLGGVLSYFVSQKLYNPVKDMISRIREHKGIDIEVGKDEMGYVANALKAVLKQGDQWAEWIEGRRNRLRDNYISSLLSGNAVVDQEIKMPDFDKDGFVCVLISIDHYRQVESVHGKQQLYYLKSLVLKLFTDILDPTFKCMGVQKEKDQIAVIVCVDRSYIKQELQALKEKMEMFVLLLSKTVDFTVTIALGDNYRSLEHIDMSYQDACNALKYRMVYGDNRILIFRDIMNEIDGQYYYPLQQETHILNFMKAGLRDELLEALDRFMAEVGNKRLSYDNLNHIFNKLLANVIQHLISSHINPDDMFTGDTTLYQQLSRLETIRDVHRWFADVLVTIVEWVETEQDGEDHNFRRIHEYIHSHFRSDIEIGSVAEYAGISYSHLRRIFARRFGTNIYNYINKLRVEEAKSLLKSTDMSIEEIALQVGYNNQQSFNRFFKKYEGITPGNYRNH